MPAVQLCIRMHTAQLHAMRVHTFVCALLFPAAVVTAVELSRHAQIMRANTQQQQQQLVV